MCLKMAATAADKMSRHQKTRPQPHSLKAPLLLKTCSKNMPTSLQYGESFVIGNIKITNILLFKAINYSVVPLMHSSQIYLQCDLNQKCTY